MTEILSTEDVKPLVPEQIHGFAPRFELGPYPLGAAMSHRRALYLWLTPITESNRAKLAYRNHDRIKVELPLSAAEVDAVQTDPNGTVAERLYVACLRIGRQYAKRVEED